MLPTFHSSIWLAALLFVGGLCPLTARASGSESRPNIVLISLDTVRADFLDFRDSKTARNLSTLAKRGAIFNQAIAGTSWTLPSHAQMFTGTPPPLHGVETNLDMIDPKTPIVTELLERAGYFTAGYFTVLFLYADYGFGRGFDVYRRAMFQEDLQDRDTSYAPMDNIARERIERARGSEYVSSPFVVSLAKTAIERAKPDEPFFLFAHFFDPHHDYVPPAPWDTAFDPDYHGELDGRGYLDDKRILDVSKNPSRQISDRDLEHMKSLYRGEIAWVDQAIGELLNLLALHHRLDDTLFIVTSDHGEEFFEHDAIMHRRNLFDESIRVPLLIVPPASRRAGLVSEVDAQVSLSDIAPTMLEFAGLPAPATMSGRSLLPVMYGATIESQPALISLLQVRDPSHEVFDSVLLQGIRTPEYKFLRSTVFRPDESPKTHAKFYDLVDDPEEKKPIKDPSHSGLIAAHDVFERMMDGVRARWRDEERTPDHERRTAPTDTFEEELMALGYLEAPSDSGRSQEKVRPWGSLAPIPRQHLPRPGKFQSAPLVAALAAVFIAAAFFVWRSTRRV